MSLRVQARDSAGNIFTQLLAHSVDEALAIARCWIAYNPGLTVEVVGVYA